MKNTILPSLSRILQEIILREYKLYSERFNLDDVYLERQELLGILKDVEETNDPSRVLEIVDYLVNNGYLVKYNYQGKEVYRSTYFDVIHDYIGIREKKSSKLTVMDYKILEPRETPLPKWSISSIETKKEVLKETINIVLKQADEVKARLIRSVVDAVLELRSKYSEMQHKAIKDIFHEIIHASGKIFIISAPTGWGKTEAFLIPALLYSFISKILTNNKESIRVLIVYPRKSLASNQIKRLIRDYVKIIKLLEKSPYFRELREYLPIVAVRDGQSIDPSSYHEGEPFRVHSVKIKDKGYEKKCEVRIKNSREVVVSCRDEEYVLPFTNVYVEKTKDTGFIPDILIVNLDMLNRSLSAPRFNDLWRNSEYLGYIVFDEAHVYTGIYFLHMINILKRLRSFLIRIHEDKSPISSKPVITFSSATLPSNYLEKLREALHTDHIEAIDYEGSEDPYNKKLEIPVIIAPRPDVAGQWIAQLIAIYNVLYTIHKGLMHSGDLDKPVPYKTIMFIDSLRYLFGLRSYIGVLLKRIDNIANEHFSTSNVSPHNRDVWSFIDKSLIDTIQKYKNLIISNSIRMHYGDLDQVERERIEEEFQSKLLPTLLLSTSTLELGIDIPDIWQIAQFRPPLSSDSFIQRIGRAGRSLETNHIALGILILTNQPSDISYLVDKERQNALFSQSELRAPINSTIQKQHIILAALDYLNTKIINNELEPDKAYLINSFYYKENIASYEEIIRNLISLINNYLPEIKEYLIKTFYREETLVTEALSEFITDLRIAGGILDKEFITDFLDKMRFIHRRLADLMSSNGPINEIQDALISLQGIERESWEKLNNTITKINQVARNMLWELRNILNKNDIEPRQITELGNKVEELKDAIDELSNSIDKLSDRSRDPYTNKFIDLALRVIQDTSELIEVYSSMEDIYDYSAFLTKKETYESISSNLHEYLSLILSKSIYSSILGTPLKTIELVYYSGRWKQYSRTENFFQAFKKLANLSVHKKPLEG